MKNFLTLIAIGLVLFACSENGVEPTDYNVLSNLPPDAGGIQERFLHEATSAPYGHFIYTPGGYSKDGPKYPLLLFLHGAGEKGNSATNPEILDVVLRNGPPRLINRKEWSPSFPMIVVSPQCHDQGWNPDKIHNLINYLIEHYRVNTKRIYITGLSMGGYGTFAYIGTYGDESYAAACVPICGGGSPNKAENFYSIPTWAFHGEADGTVLPVMSIEMIEAINQFKPTPRAKITIYPGIGHNSWSMTYDGTGMGKESIDYDRFNQNIYDWMFQYDRDLTVALVQ